MFKPVDALIPFVSAAPGLPSSLPPRGERGIVGPHAATDPLARREGGLVLNPATPLHWLDHTLEQLDLVTLDVGQHRLRRPGPHRRRAAEDRGGAPPHRGDRRDIWLEVDGGVNAGNVRRVAAAGADTFGRGSAVFVAGDYRRAIAALRDGAEAARR